MAMKNYMISWSTSFTEQIFWLLPWGAEIRVKWPTFPTSDPNECWRPYLEEHVGMQGIHWQWKIGFLDNDSSSVVIKFLRKKDATMFVLKHGN